MKTLIGIIILKKVKMKFEDWFHESDFFGSRSNRFFNDCDLYLNSSDPELKSEGEKFLLKWLKEAFYANMK
jgi:hypothetical protein